MSRLKNGTPVNVRFVSTITRSYTSADGVLMYVLTMPLGVPGAGPGVEVAVPATIVTRLTSR